MHLLSSDNIHTDDFSTRRERLSDLMDQTCHFIFHYSGKRRGQGRILRLLNKQGPLTQRELQSQLSIQSGSLSEILAKLEKSGFIIRERDPTDRRRLIISITPAGLEDLREHRIARIRRQSTLYDSLTPEEQDELIRLLMKLHDSWKVLPFPGVSASETASCCSPDQKEEKPL
ncbi:MAG: MarR family transcriptional regulator [Clostridiales bacterium]|nr:MarR family transcriptional regulator [Clostridiales bacterium]